MKTVKKIDELRSILQALRKEGKSVGFVPTMGYLHAGHLTLLRKASQENNVAVASIFVNPLQFGPGEDYAVYPRDLARDSQMAETAGISVLFAPEVEEMYPDGYENMLTSVKVEKVSAGLCGASRPGHFGGVTTVISKLFHIVEPDKAYFGQKDAQQVAVIKQMVFDLNMKVNIISVPIVREMDGLALSSRNIFLSPAERKAALVLARALQYGKKQLAAGERKTAALIAGMRAIIEQEPLAKVDYIVAVDTKMLQARPVIKSPTLLALAVKIGKTRLIDNEIWLD